MSPGQLAVGTYDGFCAGLQLEDLKRNFTFAAHQAILHSLASAGGWLVSGGGDETLHLFNAQKKVVNGYVQTEADGALVSLAFVQPDVQDAPTHLLSGTSEGTICVNEVGRDWNWLLGMAGHSKAITGLSVHPSGKLALSTARDGALRMWNLAKGRCQYKTRLADAALDVQFSPNGEAYALIHSAQIQLCDVGGAPAVLFPHTDSRASCAAFCGDSRLVTGCEDGRLHLWDTRSGKAGLSWEAHNGRLRGLACAPDAAAAAEPPSRLVSASSNGSVRLWDLRAAAAGRAVAEVDLGARITCLCLVDCQQRPEKHLHAGSRPAASDAAPRKDTAPSGKAGKGGSKAGGKADKGKAGGRPVKRPLPGGVEAESEGIASQVGVAHQGVIEFPDPANKGPKQQGGKRKQRKQAAPSK